ncbi:hypothetical protein TDB9533_01264 [Thalassocella blandensis]|nr:hypothetical protein TDB9533_01264 [Thalassocella blandensis]
MKKCAECGNTDFDKFGHCHKCGNHEIQHDRMHAHFLAGRGKSVGHQAVRALHIVEEAHGDNFNVALCGKKPQGISLGWIKIMGPITCIKCMKEIESIQEYAAKGRCNKN